RNIPPSPKPPPLHRIQCCEVRPRVLDSPGCSTSSFYVVRREVSVCVEETVLEEKCVCVCVCACVCVCLCVCVCVFVFFFFFLSLSLSLSLGGTSELRIN